MQRSLVKKHQRLHGIILIIRQLVKTERGGLDAALSFSHTGNRLTSVPAWDGVNLPASYSASHDVMGNLVTDTRKGLQFSYNPATCCS